jgi:TonB family protein
MFDAALIESSHHPGYDRRARSLPLAVAFHAAVVGTLVVSALWSTGEAPEPAIPVVFPSYSGGPPPPPGGRVNLVRATVPPRNTMARFPRPMTELPSATLSEKVEATGVEPSGPDGDPTAVGPGDPDGKWGGVPGSPPNGNGTETTADPVSLYRPGVGGVTSPVLLEKVDPVYPDTARRAQLQGVVVLEAVITASGVVDEVRIVRSPNPIFDAAVEAAVRRWRYRPATLNGRAVPVLLTVTVRFGLEG